MKPIKLTINGLNSFETEQTLDFSKLSSGVFGIFGKTGSGKSTILDAITLALYGEVKRSKQNIDFINSKSQKAEVSLVFDIFISGCNKRYEVCRIFAKKKNGKDVESSAELFEIVSNQKQMIAEGVKNVNSKIFSIVGLGADEFAKCIALPQGEFSAFLKAQPGERTKIMSNIFDLSKYGEKLSLKVKEKVSELDKEVCVLEASKAAVSFATDDVLNLKEKEFDETTKNYKNSSDELKTKNEEYFKVSKILEKQKELDKVSSELKDFDGKKEKMEKRQSELDKSSNANAVKQSYEALKQNKLDEKKLAEKIDEICELKNKKESELKQAEQEFEDFKLIFNSKLVELTEKKTKLQSLEKYDDEIKNLSNEKQELAKNTEDIEKELCAKQESLNLISSTLDEISSKIQEIDDFIDLNKPDVDISRTLEQVKEVESEIIMIEDFYFQVEKIIDQINEDLIIVKEGYNDAIVSEKEFQVQRNQIQKSIEVAFENDESSNFNKLRSCDKQLEDMRDVESDIRNIDSIIAKLELDNEHRFVTISNLDEKIAEEQAKLADLEKNILNQERLVAETREERESMLGENVISLITNHLQIGSLCPVCSNEIRQKVYAENVDLSPIENEIDFSVSKSKTLKFERDKIFTNVVSLKSRIEFERAQVEINKAEIESLTKERNQLFLKFVDDNDEREENFSKLKSILLKTVSGIEDLIELQNKIRDEELRVTLGKTRNGAKIVIYNNYLEKLYDLLYDLQKKKAEREFVIFNVNEKNKNIEDYKKRIAEGKNIELQIDDKKIEKDALRERQLKVMTEQTVVQNEISDLRVKLGVLNEKSDANEKALNGAKNSILTSGVPENVSIKNEIEETDLSISKLKKDFDEKQIKVDTLKDVFARCTSDFNSSSIVLDDKRQNIKNLQTIVGDALIKNNFASEEELESCFVSASELKMEQNQISEFFNNLKLLQMKKQELEKEVSEKIDGESIAKLKNEIDKLELKVKTLSSDVGKLGAELDRIREANSKDKQFGKELEQTSHKLDVAKELLSVLKGKALAEFVADEFLQDITIEASKKLTYLIDGRYALKFENNEFFVVDNFNDAKIRPASTLSGGETFLVSLSLALSISDAISMLSSRNMDFFFLDEGFGTLDNELCEAVISALYKLESQNLNIGLISHVAELEESIKNKVIITKDEKGSKITIEQSM